jgi:hypothetical protein
MLKDFLNLLLSIQLFLDSTMLHITNKRQISVIIIYQLVAEKYILKDLDNDEDFLLVGHIILVLVSKSRESI